MRVRRQLKAGAMPSQQKGVVLFVALIALVVMSLVGISMIRQGSSAQMIVGNLAFKEGADSAADLGVEQARSWLMSKTGAELEASVAGVYVANGLSGSFNPFTNTAWSSITDPLGQNVAYVIHRLCDHAGSVNANNNLCILFTETMSKEGVDYGNQPLENAMPYYRVTVRVVGPRNTTSYVQALLY